MSIRQSRKPLKSDAYMISAYRSKAMDMYVELFINGEEIMISDIVNSMYPYWKIKGNQSAMDARYNASRDLLIEFKYVNFLLQKEVFKIKEMKAMWKQWQTLFHNEQKSSNIFFF